MIDREALDAAEETYKAHWSASQSDRTMLARAITAYLTSAGEGAVPVGWQLVPTKHAGSDGTILAGLTWEMHDAFWGAHKLSIEKHGSFESTNAGYNAMLAAAPPPPRQDGAREGELPGPLPWSLNTEHTDPWVQDATGMLMFSTIGMSETQARSFVSWINATTPPAPDEAVEAPIAWACQANNSEWEHTNDMRYMERLRSEGWTIYSMYVEDRARSRRDVGGV